MGKKSKAAALPEQIKKMSAEKRSKIEGALGAEKEAKSESGWKSQAALKKISRYQTAVDQAKAEGRCPKKAEKAKERESVLEEDDKTTITTTKAAAKKDAKEEDDSGKGKN